MGWVTKAVERPSEEEIRDRMRTSTPPWISQKWLVIVHATVDPLPAIGSTTNSPGSV